MKKTVVALALVLLAVAASAETITQSSFQTLGFEALENNAPNESKCQNFVLFKDLNKNTDEFFTVVSLHALFEPIASADANITVFLNSETEALASGKATEFRNNWLRIRLPNEKLREQNTLKICLNNSSSTVRTVVETDSLYGTYKMAEFTPENFVKTVSTNKPQWGQEFTLTVSLQNTGSEKADVLIQYEKPGISFKHLAFLKGETEFNGSIEPGETASFSYTMKSTKVGPFTLPAAIVFFTNEFGEEEKLVSNYPVIEVKEPDIKIQAVVLNKTTEKKLVPGKEIPLEVLLTNYGQFEISNIALILPEQEGMVLNGQRNQTIPSLKPGENKTVPFTVTPTTAGTYTIGCKLAYLDFEITGVDCESTRVFVENDSFPIEYLGGIGLVIIAILVYLYYHFK
jgi:uncharacterized cupredoxin-like copper-binding protein